MEPFFAAQFAIVADATPEQYIDSDSEMRSRIEALQIPPAFYQLPEVLTEERVVPGPHGDIPVRIYRPTGGVSSDAAFVWIHGGAWKFGDLNFPEADSTSREICSDAGATVISVDYRLAVGGVRYPVPLDDVVAAFQWTVAASDSLGVDPARVSIGGGSAGANLAAGAALRLRDEGGPTPAAVLLIYPCVHAELPPPSAELASKLEELPWVATFPPEVLTPLVENYLGGSVESAEPYAMPALGDLGVLPPTLIVNCEYDGLRASGERYGRLLQEAGVEVEMICEPGVGHGHLNMPWLESTRHSLALMARWVTEPRPVAI